MSRRSKKIKVELTYRGVVYKSDLEISVVKLLYTARAKLKKSFSFSYEPVTFGYVLKRREYNPDFEILREDGSTVYIEVKGHLDRDAQQKMLAVKECHPNETFVFLFSRDSLIRKGGKMRYSDWCKKNGFGYSILNNYNEVPERWLKP